MANDPLEEKRDPRRHRWRRWDELQRLRKERGAQRTDAIIRVTGGIILLIIVLVGVVASAHLIIKILSRVF